jgi:hypothetical protein
MLRVKLIRTVNGMGVTLDQDGPFHALFAPVDRRRAGDFAPAGGLGDGAVHGDVGQ